MSNLRLGIVHSASMAITIRNSCSGMLQRSIADKSASLTHTFERLSSGQRINKASDDAAGLSIVESLNVNARISSQALRNVNDAISVVSVAEETLNTLKELSVRQQELAQQTANGTYSTTQRRALDEESEALTNEYNRIILNTSYNGMSLFKSPWEDITVQGGIDGTGAFSLGLSDDISSKITPGSYFTLSSSNYIKNCYFRIDGVGDAPSVPGTIDVAIDLYTANTQEISQLDFLATPEDGEYLYLYDSNQDYCIWFDSGSGDAVDPQIAQNSYRISTSGLDATQVASKVADVISSFGSFSVKRENDQVIQLTTIEAGFVNAVDSGAWSIGVAEIQQATKATITADEVAQAVATKLSGDYTAVASEGGKVTVTFTNSGNYHDAEDNNSNTWVEVLHQGTGLTTYHTNFVPVDMTFADFNNDGVTDMATAEYWGNSTSVRLGYGDGTFQAAQVYSLPIHGYRVVSADLNGDEMLDIVTAAGSAVGVLINKGDGTFAEQVQYTMSALDARAEDFDGDGDIDILSVTSNQISLRLNNGDGTFSNRVTYSCAGVRRVDAGDVNNDGKMDLVTVESTNTISVWLNNGNATFSRSASYTTGSSPTTPEIADFNGDGWLDIASADSGNALVSVRLNNGDGTFGARAAYTTKNLSDLVAADFNGDGKVDIAATALGAGVVSVLMNNGNGTFANVVAYSFSVTGQGIDAGDINGDGSLDLSTPEFEVRFRLNNGNGTFYDPRGDTKEVVQLTFADLRGSALVEGIDLETVSGAKKALGTLNSRLDKIDTGLSSIRTTQTRLESVVQTLANSKECFALAASRIEDADIAEESGKAVSTRIKLNIAQALFAQANQQPKIVLDLLRSSSSGKGPVGTK